MHTVSGQHIYDVLLQETGTIEGLHEMVRRNDIPIDHHFGSGDEVEVPAIDAEEVVDYFSGRGIVVATGEHAELDYPGGSYSDAYGTDYD